MKNSGAEWWRSTATHMWRSYFTLKQSGSAPENMTHAEKTIYETCDRIFTDNISPSDQGIVRMYFTSRWGDDQYAVEDYSLKHGIPVPVIWIVIKRASRSAIESVGLLDRRED